MSSEASGDIVVISALKPVVCADCKEEIRTSEYLRMQDEGPLCMECADLDHLVFLPSGDAALTRRSKKESSLWAVVVKWSRPRKRYERQGMLVEAAAREAAEIACAGDEDARAAAREKALVRRTKEEAKFQVDFLNAIKERYPKCPEAEAVTISNHACEKYSGRVGRSADAKKLDTDAVDLAVRAHIRHVHTCYDSLLQRGIGRKEARAQIADRVDAVARGWR